MSKQKDDVMITALIARGLTIKHTAGDDGELMIDAAHKIAEMVDHIEELRRALKPFADRDELTAHAYTQARIAYNRGA